MTRRSIKNGVVTLGNFQLEIPCLPLDIPCMHIIGPNGVGKSTLLKIILGLTELDAGEIPRDATEQYGYVPQHYRSSLLPWLNAKDNLLLHKKSESIIEDLIETGFNPADLNKRPSHLSGGQCQRISVVREASAGFDWVIMDEPFSGIDYKAIPKLAKLLARAVNQGAQVVMTSHTTLPDELTSIRGFKEIAIERMSDKSAAVIFRSFPARLCE
uniref:ABC-type nitrate/sulfonate/bicarbonate transport system, ATPase component n=1 Tax=Candidatus Kentrum sp. TUN TaxID=2126343 RepID=A0A450ZCF5_9GAMM|nr:MAG: ABC-type nitrate/sulfonate/bicarbonate transport system, ATPase component [Candidatus Kentron sp. TUN]VFK51475.1 MAG: ABC-type nitrate/sulfonate/bicarbonate transport system, ATPase component [Candidatus Kentron sp. TUN]